MIFWWGVLAVVAAMSLPNAPVGALPSCEVVLRPPVHGESVRSYLPIDRGGHWGVDLAAGAFEVVRAPVSGKVTFAGEVVGNNSVTLAPDPAVRVSLSHLSEIWVTPGRWVTAGHPLGRAGTDHGISAVHLSLRVGGQYTDPQPALDCHPRVRRVWGTLRLLPVGQAVGPSSGPGPPPYPHPPPWLR